MAEIIKFPTRHYCECCGKPLDINEGVLCPVLGCENFGCRVCAEGSIYCSEHIKLDPEYGRG